MKKKVSLVLVILLMIMMYNPQPNIKNNYKQINSDFINETNDSSMSVNQLNDIDEKVVLYDAERIIKQSEKKFGRQNLNASSNTQTEQTIGDEIFDSTKLNEDSVVYRAMNAEGQFSLITKIAETKLKLYAENEGFRNVIDNWWSAWVGSNIKVEASTCLAIFSQYYANGKTKAFYDGFYGDLFMDYKEPSQLEKDCSAVLFEAIKNDPSTVNEVNNLLPSNVDCQDLSQEELTWHLQNAEAMAVLQLVVDHEEFVFDAALWVMKLHEELDKIPLDSTGDTLLERMTNEIKEYINDNIKSFDISETVVSVSLAALGGIANLNETNEKIQAGLNVFNKTNTSIQTVVDEADLSKYYDNNSINNIKQSWSDTRNSYSNITSELIIDTGLSGAEWIVNELADTVLENPITGALNLSMSVACMMLNSEIKNSTLFSQYCVGNNLLIAAKDVYNANIVKLTQILLGQLTVTEEEFQEVQNNLRSSVAVIYLVRGQLAAYERELTIAFFPNGEAIVPPVNQCSKYKKLGLDFLDLKNVTLNDLQATLPDPTAEPTPSATPAPEPSNSEFIFDKATGTITKYVGSAKSIVIPDTIDGVSVTKIGTAFWNCDTITKVTIPDSVIDIDRFAFWNCFLLEKIDVAKDNGKYQSIDGVLYSKDGKKIYSYPKGNKRTSYEIKMEVTKIEPFAFCSAKNLEKIVLLNNVSSIGESAFQNCDSLSECGIPNSVIELSTRAFYDCDNLKEISIPDSVKKLSYEIFFHCDQLAKVQLGINIDEISEGTFMGCEKLEKIVIPNSVQSIGYGAFYDCKNLNNITLKSKATDILDVLPTGTKIIGYAPSTAKTYATKYGYEFEEISDTNQITLESIAITTPAKKLSYNIGNPIDITELEVTGTYSDGSTKIESITLDNITGFDSTEEATDQVLTITVGDKTCTYTVQIIDIPNEDFTYEIIDGKAHITKYIGSSENVIIPNALGGAPVTQIGDNAFENCERLVRIEIPTSITTIGDFAFNACGLTTIDLPDSVTNIGEGAFSWCVNLTDVLLSEKITSIEPRVFNHCYKLNVIDFPDNLESIGEEAFSNCRNLSNISLPDTVTTIGKDAFFECTSLASFSIPRGVSKIEEGVFAYCSCLKNITIHNSVTAIGEDAFVDCGLEKIDIPNSITSIGIGAFRGCVPLNNVTIPKSLNKIENSMFMECGYLTNIMLPDSITSIGGFAFAHCNLEEIDIPNSVKMIDEQAFAHCNSLNDIIIPESTTNIKNMAFWDCQSLSKITIPSSVTQIGEDVFGYCSDDLIIYGDAGSYAQTYANNNTIPFRIQEKPKSLVSIAITNIASKLNYFIGDVLDISDLEVTGTYSDGSTNVEKITVDSITGFNSTTAATDQILTIKVEEKTCTYKIQIIDSDYAYNIVDGKAYIRRYNRDETSITIPETLDGLPVTSIGSGVFSNLSEVTAITLPETVTSIGDSVFNGCSSLTKINLPKGLLSIGKGAFRDCKSLTNLTLPEGITQINDSTFQRCIGLTSVSIPEKVSSIGNGAFWGCTGLKEISIPENVESIGDCAFADCSGLSDIKIPNSVTNIGQAAFLNSSLKSFTLPLKGDNVTIWGDGKGNTYHGGDTVKELTTSYKVQAVIIDQKYTINFETNGGTTISPITKLVHTIISNQPMSQRTGYKFSGWFTEATFNNKVTFPYIIVRDITLYAKWEKLDSKPTATPTAALAATPTATATPTVTPTLTVTPTPSVTSTQTVTATLTVTPTPTVISTIPPTPLPTTTPTPVIITTIEPTLTVEPTPAQDIENEVKTGQISGILRDSQGNPLWGFKVTLHSDPITTFTDSKGIFIFKEVPLSHHTLLIANTAGEEIANYELNLSNGDKTNKKVSDSAIDITYTSSTENIETVFEVSEDLHSVVVKDIKINEEETFFERWIVIAAILFALLFSISGLIYWLIKRRK